MKILISCIQFERGGAARVAAILCNGLQQLGYEISLVTDLQNWNCSYEINKGVAIYPIDTKGRNSNLFIKSTKWFKCSFQIRKYIKNIKPDIIISIEAMMFLCSWLGNIGIKIPIIAADHTSFNRKIAPIIDFVRYYLYNKADGLSILTQKDARLLNKKFPHKRVIYNPISFSSIPSINTLSLRRKSILCAGRLEVWKIKGFDIILSIWGQIANKYPDWILEIAGSTDDKITVSYLNNILKEKNIIDRVRLLGHVDDMQALYQESSIFALPSRMEGFPMVLLEAMSQGCACIAFDLYGASSEMLTSYKEGIIVSDGNIDDFQKELEALILNEELRWELACNAIKRTETFSIETFIKNWDIYIREILNSYN